jgi:hypothetical protein
VPSSPRPKAAGESELVFSSYQPLKIAKSRGGS